MCYFLHAPVRKGVGEGAARGRKRAEGCDGGGIGKRACWDVRESQAGKPQKRDGEGIPGYRHRKAPS